MSETTAGEWLRGELARKGISVRDATEAVGLKATQAVYAWMSDKAAPTDEAAAKLAVLLKVPEVEVRRRFGLWVPAETELGEPSGQEDLDAVEALLEQAMQELNRLKQKRQIS